MTLLLGLKPDFMSHLQKHPNVQGTSKFADMKDTIPGRRCRRSLHVLQEVVRIFKAHAASDPKPAPQAAWCHTVFCGGYGMMATTITGAVCSAVEALDVGRSMFSDTVEVPDAAMPLSRDWFVVVSTMVVVNASGDALWT